MPIVLKYILNILSLFVLLSFFSCGNKEEAATNSVKDGDKNNFKWSESISKDNLPDFPVKGFINGKERFEIMSQAKVFLMTSYFESYGLVNIEAMKLWLPVVAYKLPVFWVFKKWMIKVPILDNDAFSQEVLRLLENEEKYNHYSQEAREFSQDYSWENTGKEIYEIINE